MLIRLDIESDGMIKKPNKVVNIREVSHESLYLIDQIKKDVNGYYLEYLKNDGIASIWSGTSNNSINIVDTSIYDIHSAEREGNLFHTTLKAFIREKNIEELEKTNE